MLVVGLPFLLVADEQGTPVQFRDGPAAVTECYQGIYICLPLLRLWRFAASQL